MTLPARKLGGFLMGMGTEREEKTWASTSRERERKMEGPGLLAEKDLWVPCFGLLFSFGLGRRLENPFVLMTDSKENLIKK
jgi:hypothetical protein